MISVMKCGVSGSGPVKALKIAGFVVLGIVAVAVLAIVFGLIVKWLWNALMPDIFGLPVIGYWQAVGLVVLGHIFFGAGHEATHSTGSRRKKKKVKEENSYRLEMERDYADFWREEGRDAFKSWMHRENGTSTE